MNILLGVVVDSDVRANDTEVRRGTPLTSPFIEGIYGVGRLRRHESHPPSSRDGCTTRMGGLWGSRLGCRTGGWPSVLHRVSCIRMGGRPVPVPIPDPDPDKGSIMSSRGPSPRGVAVASALDRASKSSNLDTAYGMTYVMDGG